MRKEFLIQSAVAVPFILLFNIYLSTVCPTVYAGDSGELTVAAFSLGTPHPSGYPLFSMLGKLFALIPFGNIAFRVNLMSVFFSILTVWMIYLIIYKLTESRLSSILGSFSLAFTQVFWLQTVSAEVYPLHTFFVALLIWIILIWDKKQKQFLLYVITFTVGLSFTNHLQTLMLIPALLFILIYRNVKILKIKTTLLCIMLFIIALSVYLYLPIRTHMGAAIHWGDPDTWSNFYSVVSGKNHRSGYVFNKTIPEYIIRFRETLWMVFSQYGVLTILALVGFWKVTNRWKIFYALIIFFDFFYTVFLNTVSIEVTSFNLPTLMVLAILLGVGSDFILNKLRRLKAISGTQIFNFARGVIAVVPIVFLVSNYGICNQSLNYTAYEDSLNIFRTINPRGTVFVNGDNFLFPTAYCRFVERMREDVNIYDPYYLFFKMPYVGASKKFIYTGNLRGLIHTLEKILIEKNTQEGVFVSEFNPNALALPDDYRFIPYGILAKIIKPGEKEKKDLRSSIWNYYITESLEDNFYRDYMTGEITANYNLVKGEQLILLGGVDLGMKRLKLASEMAYDNDAIHTSKTLFLVNTGFYKEARKELERASHSAIDKGIIQCNWGYYYIKQGKIKEAIKSYYRAVSLDS